jgi:hypothetical protein
MTCDKELFGLAMDFANSPEFPALKRRFAGFAACNDHATAAAFGYCAAMKDVKKQETRKKETIYDTVCEAVEDDAIDAMIRTDAIFTAIYKWLDDTFDADGYGKEAYLRKLIAAKFETYIAPGDNTTD